MAEAHARLEQMLPPEELAKIDAMKSEKDMIAYHMGLGMGIRNDWELWSGGPLAKYLNDLGFRHPDDMSGVILETFWCKRHGKDFRLKERAEESARYWANAKKAAEDEKMRVADVSEKIRAMMMGLRFRDAAAPTVRMPDRIDREVRARFLVPYRDGVFLTVRESVGQKDDFVTVGFYFDPADCQLHRVQVPEIANVHSAVVAGRTAWFVGDNEARQVLLGIEGEKRTLVSLPLDGPLPQLGLDGKNLLAVYPKVVFRLVGGQWEHLFAVEDDLPKSGPPPELRGDRLFLRDEGRGENQKRLWWVQAGTKPTLTSLDKDVKVVGLNGPNWVNSFSYAVAPSGELWACVGESYARKSLLRRASDGTYAVAIMNNSLAFTPDLFGSEETDQGLSVSAVTLLPDSTVLLVGDLGLYRVRAGELTKELAFANTHQEIPVNEGKNVYHWSWDPSNVLTLGTARYMISATFGGIYLLGKNTDGQWSFVSLDEHPGGPVVW